MKKLFFTLALLVSVFALTAQSYTVTEKETGNIVENGASYYVYGDGEATWGELNIEFDVTANENVRLIGEKVEMQVVENTQNYFCWGNCFLSTVYVSDPVNLDAGQFEVFSMHYMYNDAIEDVAGLEQIMQYYLYPANNPDDKFVINVIFKYSLDGVEDISNIDEFSNAYPMPASNVVNFDYNFASSVNSAMVAVYNMMGQEVLRSDISGMSGKLSINVSDLTDGVYFYSLIVNGKTEKSNKLVIRK